MFSVILLVFKSRHVVFIRSQAYGSQSAGRLRKCGFLVSERWMGGWVWV